MRALVTGGAGFIGSHLAESLVSRGWKVDIIDDLSTGDMANIPSFMHAKVGFYKGRVNSKSPWQREAAVAADVIFHLAAVVGVRRVVSDPFETISLNTQATLNILELAREFRKPILIASSSEVYGRRDDERLLTEDMDLHIGTEPRWGYAAGKLHDEFLALSCGKKFGTPVVVARLFNTTGPRQVGTYGMVIPRMIDAALDHQDIEVYGSGKQRRSFARVDLTVMQLEALITNPAAYGQIVNVGSDQDISIGNLALLVKNQVNFQSGYVANIRHVPADSNWQDISNRKPSLEKVSALCGGEMTHPSIHLIVSDLVQSAIKTRGETSNVQFSESV